MVNLSEGVWVIKKVLKTKYFLFIRSDRGLELLDLSSEQFQLLS